MNKYVVMCFIFVQSSIITGAERSIKRASDPRQPNGAPKSMPIPQQKKTNRLTPERSSRVNSPYEFSPTASLGTVYYCGVFGALDEKDFSPVSHSSK